MTRFTPLFALLLAAAAVADDKNPTYTDPAQADADYARQGEFAGGGWGLQVVGQGDGKFGGMLYAGGLPGNGWNRRDRYPLSGALENNAIALSGGERSVVVDASNATVRDSQGRAIGQLIRVKRTSPTLGLRPPAAATILFNGTSLDQFVNAKMTDDHLLRMGTMTKEPVGDFRLHIEFRVPYMPKARGQGRANSGVYIQQRYEVQILDSFGLEGVDNECGALYKQQPPAMNLALPPLTWQTYDIWFRQPRWSDDGKTRVEPARITVLHNGAPIHWNYEIKNKTGGGKPEGPELFPIALQDHGNPVVFRNVWMIPDQGTYPTASAGRPSTTTTTWSCPPRRRLFRRG
jgi:hypothetical protein